MVDDKKYIAVAGFVQFDPRVREKGRDVVVKLVNTKLDPFHVMVWDSDFEHVEINKGDYLAVDGVYTTRLAQKQDGTEVTYHNLSAKALVILPNQSSGTGPTQVVNKPVPVDESDSPF